MNSFQKCSVAQVVVAVVALILIGIGVYFISVSKSVSNKPAGDETLVTTAKEVLVALKSKDYVKLQDLTSLDGISWNIYPDSLDLTKNDISKADVSRIPTNTQKYMFGYTDGKGDPIELTISDYLDKWIYNHDYLAAQKVLINQVATMNGNTSNNILTYSAGRSFVAFHFDGFDTKYEGMDWTTLYLIFDKDADTFKLRGIVKANWTI